MSHMDPFAIIHSPYPPVKDGSKIHKDCTLLRKFIGRLNMKKLGAILLIAGTCIGSGMIALPMVLAKIGLIPSLILMIIIWAFVYYTSLINLELNLQIGQGLPLGELGKRLSGKGAELIGIGSLKILSYSLLAVYIYGGSSIVQKLLASKMEVNASIETIATVLALCAALILLCPIKFIDYFNRVLFMSLLGVVAILILGLAVSIKWTNLPLFSTQQIDATTWMAIIPVVFTSFGFQVIFHTLTNYCQKNTTMLKQAFFWGSLIPAIVYLLWTSSVLSVVFHENPTFYVKMMEGQAEVGALIEVLSTIAKWKMVQLLVWLISLLAIITSIIGVGIGLYDSLKEMLPQPIKQQSLRKILATVITIGPAYFAVLYIPNAFIAVLGFAGMILAVIAVILPIYLFWQIQTPQLHYHELKRKGLIILSFCAGLGVIVCELYNIVTS
ncbi:MAG: amino acid permease [Parachlamydiaceae bacterium]